MVEDQTKNIDSQIQGIKVAALLMVAVLMLLFFLPWVSSPLVAQFSGIASYVSGQTVSSELSIPGLFFAGFDLMRYMTSSQSTVPSSGLGIILIFGITLGCIWAWALIDSVVSGIAVLASGKEPKTMKRASAVCIAASGITIVSCYYVDFFIKGSMSNATSGLSSYVGITYLSPTIWVWLALIVSIAELVLLHFGASDPRVESVVSKISSVTTGTVSALPPQKGIDELYAAYGKAAFEAIKADPALPKIAPKEWAQIDDRIEAENARKLEEERRAAEAKKAEEERKAEAAAALHQSDQATDQIKTITCPVCAHEIPAISKFCPNCGHKRTVVVDVQSSSSSNEPRSCHSCGASLRPGASFCAKCGSKVR